jgi:hypothetical protein
MPPTWSSTAQGPLRRTTDPSAGQLSALRRPAGVEGEGACIFLSLHASDGVKFKLIYIVSISYCVVYVFHSSRRRSLIFDVLKSVLFCDCTVLPVKAKITMLPTYMRAPNEPERRMPVVQLRTLTVDYCEFLLSRTDASVANALRRIILAEVGPLLHCVLYPPSSRSRAPPPPRHH